jgi:hypothetical protein
MLIDMENIKLSEYIAEKLRAGVRTEDIKQQLILVGWSEDEANESLVKGLITSGIPAPLNMQKGGGRLASTVEVVLNLFSFILLGGVASALIVLFYQIINHYFPDSLQIGYSYYDTSSSSIHYAIAALIIGFPLYVVTVKMWFRRYREDEAKIESKLTKWITYLVLLAAAVTIVGDLVVALFYFLQGEITARFFLKALVILVVFGFIFGFYYLERRKIQYKINISRNTFNIFGYAVGLLVLLGIILGFIAGGSPTTERKRGFDETRSQNLSALASCISGYGYNTKALPATLSALYEDSQYSYCSMSSDPETGTPYTYRIITPSEKLGEVTQGKFELCANFSLEATKESIARNEYTSVNDKWSLHGVGESCDTETVVLNRNDQGGATIKPGIVPALVR